MKKILMLALISIIFLFPNKVFANSIEEQLEIIDFSPMNKALENSGIDFKDTVLKAINGELDLSLSNIINQILKMLFDEIYQNSYLMKNLLIVAIMSALLKNLTDSFKHKEIGELGYYITYIIIIILLFNSFQIGIGIMTELVNDIAGIMEASIPLVMSLLLMSGYVSTAFVFNPMLFFSVNVITRLVRDFISPVVILLAVMQIVNHLSLKSVLANLTEQGRKGIAFILKGFGIIFITILSLQRISTPIVNNLLVKTAKVSVSAIPVVGDVLTGAVDTVMYFTSAAKSGIMVACIVVIVIVSALPLIKLAALILVYKLTAIIIEPICEERLVECVNSIGSLATLLLGSSFMVVVMFIFYVMITLSL